MVAVKKNLDNLYTLTGLEGRIIAQVHDEIVLDFPFSKDKGNLPVIQEIKGILDSMGDNLIPRIPIPLGIEYHPDNWGAGEVIV